MTMISDTTYVIFWIKRHNLCQLEDVNIFILIFSLLELILTQKKGWIELFFIG